MTLINSGAEEGITIVLCGRVCVVCDVLGDVKPWDEIDAR